MLVRIVKLTFKKENISSFEQLFDEVKNKILNFEGCTNLILYQDLQDPSVFFTYSYWNDEKVLEQYRNSEFFKLTWARTKLLFDKKPEAWSLTTISQSKIS